MGCSVRPPRQDFGAVPVGAASATFNFTVEATCPSSVTLTSGNPREFVIVQNGCIGGVAPGKPCVVGVQFRPVAGGRRTGSLIVTPATGPTATAMLEGTGQIPVLSWKPDTVRFGRVPVGSRETQRITLINEGNAATGAIRFVVSPPFSVASSDCKELAPNQNCEVVVLFFPDRPGEHAGSLQATGDVGGSASAPLQGAGVEQPVQPLTITPSSHGFGALFVGTRSQPVPFRITAGIDLAEVRVTSTSAEFVIAANGCPTGLAAGGRCEVSVVFAPAVAGQKQAALQVSARAGGIIIRQPPTHTASASLTGVGRLDIIIREPPPVITQ